LKLMVFALVAALAIFAVACEDDNGNGNGQTPTNGNGEVPANGNGDGNGEMQQWDSPPEMTIDADREYFATIRMEHGDVRLELFQEVAPGHVNNFVFLAREGFYDGLIFHRVIPGFMAQGGDPTGTGAGGPGYTIEDEINDRPMGEGALSMAHRGPNTAGSQFFITFSPQPHLEEDFTVFGQLVDGRDALDGIEAGQPPANPTRIITVEIEER
jgi:peptidyl-prolyl cis-trans isomerase B (cyclophilin B)